MPENPSKAAAARRERARTSRGQFGKQQRPDLPTVASSDTTGGEESAGDLGEALHTAGLCGGVGMGSTVCRGIASDRDSRTERETRRSDHSAGASAPELTAAIVAMRAVAEAIRTEPDLRIGWAANGNVAIDATRAKHGEFAVRLADDIPFMEAVARIRAILAQHDCSLRIDRKGWITVFGPTG